MASIPRIAWRNLGRNRRRTLVAASALCFGIGLTVASYGLTDGMNEQILHALVRFDLGHVQIHERGYAKRRELRRPFANPESVLALVRGEPGVRAASARAYGFALVGSRDRSTGVELVGVDPRSEPEVTELDRQLVAGRYLDPEPTPWPPGRELTAEERAADERLTRQAEEAAMAEMEALPALAGSTDGAASAAPARLPAQPVRAGAEASLALARALSPPPARAPRVLVGASLAKVLGVGVGDRLFASTQAVDGAAESVELEVAGVHRTGTQQHDRGRIYLHLGDMQRLVHLGGGVHEIALVLAAAGQAPAVASRVGRRLGASGRAELAVRPWGSIRPDIAEILRLNDASMLIMMLVIFLVATLGVVSTMLMAVFERTRELGMLRAIGMSGTKIVLMIVTEALLLVICASAAGTALGLALDLYMVIWGVDLSLLTAGVSFGGIGLAPVLYGAITAKGLFAPALVLAACSLLASLYPAARAARLPPAIGMRET
ncbi:MAG: ABC transporter permease [Deltaproteobacteria bacterium]|nr:ABC transporter permease [Deltaproteobacteria bacterium]